MLKLSKYMLPVLLTYMCAIGSTWSIFTSWEPSTPATQSTSWGYHPSVILILIIIEITKSSISKVITIVRSLSQDECHQHWQHNHLGQKKSRKSSTGVHPKSDLTGDKFHFCIFWQLLVLDCNFWQQLVLDCNFSLIRYGISHTT